MRYIDLHCDTAGRMLYENQGLKKNKFSVDIEKLNIEIKGIIEKEEKLRTEIDKIIAEIEVG